jgi:hypothetical protein
MQARDNDCSAHHTAANSRGGEAASPPRARDPIGTVGRLAGMLLALALASSPHATVRAGTVVPPTVYCVGTVNELRNVLAAIPGTGSFDVRIRSGYYPLTAPAGGVFNYGLMLKMVFGALPGQTGASRISGAWGIGCTQQAEVITVANATLIDGQDQTGLLYVESEESIVPQPLTPAFDLQIDRLQFANGAPPLGHACVKVNRSSGLPRDLNVTFDRVRVDLCTRTALGSQAGGPVTVRNSVFIANGDAFHPGVNISAYEGAASLYNNTFRLNRMGADSFGAQVRIAGQTVYAFNNLFADADYGGGTARDIRVVDGTGIIRNNRLAGSVVHETGGGLIQSGNTAVAPGFANTSGPQLAANSALRDLGLTAAPAPGVGTRDIAGSIRVQGAAVEIGAYELAPLALPDAVFANGFEAP